MSFEFFNKNDKSLKKVSNTEDTPEAQKMLSRVSDKSVQEEIISNAESKKTGVKENIKSIKNEIKDTEATLLSLKTQKEMLDIDMKNLLNKIRRIRNEEKKIDDHLVSMKAYLKGSALYETQNGTLISSLPDEHPVIKEIERKNTDSDAKKSENMQSIINRVLKATDTEEMLKKKREK
ncbi:MAG: hypothetical protein PHH40_00025 [Candidatus Moranbacteria bacterium]|nr:hypothetical protein [Candidatus Moranbacteria bacterium]MDD3965257.1 hypothetical protein [Candidatus Moranbacteria bacterium]